MRAYATILVSCTSPSCSTTYMAAEPYTLVEGGVAKETAQDSKAFLESRPR